MKKNLTNIALGIAILFIWGTIGYKIYQATTDSSNELIMAPISNTQKEVNLIPEDYKLLMNYKDPFTKKSVAAKKEKTSSYTPQTTSPKETLAPTKTKAPIKFPNIQYQGMIKNKITGNNTALLKIDGQLKQLRKGAHYNKVYLSEIWNDSIRLRLEGSFLVVYRK